MARSTLSRLAPALTLAGAVTMAAALFASRSKLPASGEDPVVKVSEAQVEVEIKARLTETPALRDDMDKLTKEVKDAASAQAMFVAEAFSQGLAKSDYLVRNRLVEMQVMALYDQADAGLTEEAIEKYFLDHRDKYVTSAKRRVIHLFVPVTNVVGDNVARQQLESMLHDPTSWGDPRWTSEEELRSAYGPTFARQVFEMEPGDWNGPVRSGVGWHYVRVMEAEPARPLDLSEARPQVTEDLRRELRQESYNKELKRLQEKYKVEWVK